MKCATPTIAFRRPGINPATGKHYSPVSFRQFWKIFKDSKIGLDRRVQAMKDYYSSCPSDLEPVLLPCKHCMCCMRSYRREWAYRLVCESKFCKESMFLTLTVDDENLDSVFPGSSLRHKPFQDFMKRLRIYLERGYYYDYVPPFTPSSLFGKLPRKSERRLYCRSKIRFYMCGEYGDTTGRPHYHCCVFGARFPDAYFAKKVGSEFYYTSPTLLKLWPYGKMSLFSDVTPSSAAYVAGYVDKKLEKDSKYYTDLGLAPEYVRMSNGLGIDYLDEYADSLYRFDSDGEFFGEFHFLGDNQVSAPRYFDEKFALRSPDRFAKLMSARECRRLASLASMPVEVQLNESGRKNSVLLARKKEREIRELT